MGYDDSAWPKVCPNCEEPREPLDDEGNYICGTNYFHMQHYLKEWGEWSYPLACQTIRRLKEKVEKLEEDLVHTNTYDPD